MPLHATSHPYKFTHPSSRRHYRIDLTKPNPNPPPPMKLDIDPSDGYVLFAHGDLAKIDETFLPAPPSEIEVDKWERPIRFSARRPIQARRCSLGKSRNYKLGSISPTCSGTRFPDIPGPDSPASARREFEKFVKQIEKRNAEVTPSRKNDVAAALSARPEGSRYPTTIAKGRPPAAVKPVAPKLTMPEPVRAKYLHSAVEAVDEDEDEEDLQSEAPSSGPSTPNNVTEFIPDLGPSEKAAPDLSVELDMEASHHDTVVFAAPALQLTSV
ncbi:unnamed protein product [Peniophora sp. CBMAI 1063]|nr:unnamed protein product [Peniophora sp. CBMAI 1063]